MQPIKVLIPAMWQWNEEENGYELCVPISSDGFYPTGVFADEGAIYGIIYSDPEEDEDEDNISPFDLN